MNDTDRCPGTNRQDERCGHPAGWGTDTKTGPCKFHGGLAEGGAREGAGAPEGNVNSVTHGAYADCNSFYQDVLDDAHRGLVDDIFEDYMADYEAQHGEPPLGLESELFRLSVSHVKDVVLDSWASERPESLESGNPLVGEETHYTEGGQQYNRYKESVVLRAQKSLSSDRRQWLKDLGLLEDPETQKASAISDLKGAWKERAQNADST